MNPRKIIISLFFIAGVVSGFEITLARTEPEALPVLTVFYSPTCHRCSQIKETVMPGIEKQYQGQILIESLDISDIRNYQALMGLRKKYRPKMVLNMPVFFFQGRLVGPTKNMAQDLQRLISFSLAHPVPATGASSVDLIAHFRNFTPFAILAAGLIDGINPCAFTVIVFFSSFLALQGYKKRELIVIGAGFILAVFLTYLLIGVGLFNFLYSLKKFWLVTRVFNIAIGAFSIILGFFSLYDFLRYRKTRETEGLLLQLPASVKQRIHRVIGLHYRKPRTASLDGTLAARPIFRLTLAAFSTGFLVSLLEAVCTGQTYLPTLTFILKTTALKAQALFYLLAYNLMFIVPLGVVFVFALMGASSQQFGDFLKKRLLVIKALMALLFFGFGSFLIWRG